MPGGIHPPLEVVLSWPRPNVINPELRPNTMAILAYVLGPVTILLVLARLWVRIFHQRNPGWDDWLMLIAMIPTMALTVLFPLASNHGFNMHVWDAISDTRRVVDSRKYILTIEVVFCVASGLIKVSILLFYRRLSARVVSKAFWWVTWLTIGFIVAYSIALTLAPIFGCQPISAFWDQVDTLKVLSGYEYHCFDEGADVFAASVISVVQDFITALLPTFLYWNLQIPLRQKIALFGIFAIGYGVVALGCARAYYSWRTFYETYDVTWSTWDLMLTSLLELHIGCFCANAPALKVVFKHFFRDKFPMRSRSRTPRNDALNPSDGNYSNTKWSSFGGTLVSKVASLLSSSTQSRSRDGYISENNANVTVDPQGGVHVQHDVHISRSPNTSVMSPTSNRHESFATADLIYDHYYEEEIDLGRYTTGRNSKSSSMRSTRVYEGTDLSALPPLPMTPVSMKTLKGSRSGSTTKAEDLPKSLEVPEQPRRSRAGTPFPSLGKEQDKKEWHSWA